MLSFSGRTKFKRTHLEQAMNKLVFFVSCDKLVPETEFAIPQYKIDITSEGVRGMDKETLVLIL